MPTVENPMQLLRPLLMSSLLGASAASQGTLWVVDDDAGPGVDFADLGSATAAAQDGDAILVRAGTYAGFATIDAKSLVVIAEPGALLNNLPGDVVPVGPTLAVANLAANQRVLVLGGEYTGHEGLGSDKGAFRVETSTGPVWFQDVDAIGRFGVDVYHSARVHLVDVEFEGTRTVFEVFLGPTGDALRTAGFSRVAAWGSHLLGATGEGSDCNPSVNCAAPLLDGGNGVRLRENGSLWASGSTLEGGYGGNGGTSCQPGWADGTGGDGGHAAELEDTSHLAAAGSTLIAGTGGHGGGGKCNGAPGQTVTGTGTSSLAPGPARSLTSTSPVRAGETSELVIRGAEGDFVFGIVSPFPLYLDLPGFTGPLAVGVPFNLQAVGALPASGEVSIDLTTTPLPEGTDFLVRYLQPLFASSGGEFILGAPTALVILDESF